MTKLVSKRPEWNNFLLYNVIIHNAQDKCLFQLKVNHTMAHMGESFSIGDLIYELITRAECTNQNTGNAIATV